MTIISIIHLVIGIITALLMLTKAILITLLKIKEKKKIIPITKSHYDLAGGFFWLLLVASLFLGFAGVAWSFPIIAHVILATVFIGLEILLILMSPVLVLLINRQQKPIDETKEIERKEFPIMITLVKDWIFTSIVITVVITGLLVI